MTHRTAGARLTGLLALVLVAAGLSVVVATLTATDAEAAARVTVRNDQGTAQADSRYRTELTISGSGFQVVKGGFGGVYLAFGWVRDRSAWKPSNGGVTGDDYRYIPDSEDTDNQGYLSFIAFPGSSTASEAHAVLSGNGSFTVELTVPGPTFDSVDRNGKVSTVDCTKVTCGVITFGAHGVTNPANETFTPVAFTDLYDDAPTDDGTDDGADDDATDERSATEPDTDRKAERPARRGKPVVRTDRLTAVAGHAMTFTGGGFLPGEQVVGVLDDGIAAIGPMIAGPSGEVAGFLQLPTDIAPGTHEIRLTGAASGTEVKERFAVRAAATSPESTTTADSDDGGGFSASRIFLIVAAALFAIALITLLVRLVLLRRRRTTRTAAPAGAVPAPGGAP